MLLTTSHDGYLARFGVVHRRVLMVAQDGTRLDGEDTVSPAPGGRIKGNETDYALRFHLHPSVKASRLSDARGVMLVLPNRDVWTFEALDDKVELEDSVFLAGNDGPRRTAQIVIRQDSRNASSIRWSFVRSTTSASATDGPPQRAPRAGIAAVEQCRASMRAVSRCLHRCERRRKLLTTRRSRDWRLWMEHHREARECLPRAWA